MQMRHVCENRECEMCFPVEAAAYKKGRLASEAEAEKWYQETLALRKERDALRAALEEAAAIILRGTPIKSGPVFAKGSEAETLLNAVDEARQLLLKALKK